MLIFAPNLENFRRSQGFCSRLFEKTRLFPGFITIRRSRHGCGITVGIGLEGGGDAQTTIFDYTANRDSAEPFSPNARIFGQKFSMHRAEHCEKFTPYSCKL
jgi:hypothetical protein